MGACILRRVGLHSSSPFCSTSEYPALHVATQSSRSSASSQTAETGLFCVVPGLAGSVSHAAQCVQLSRSSADGKP